MQILNKLWQRRNNISQATRYLALLLSLVALMVPMTSSGNVRAQEQNQAREKKSAKSQGQNATKEAQSDKATSFSDAQSDQGADSQKTGDTDIKPSAPWPIGGGDGSFSGGVYNCAGTSYTYNVVNGPPNTWGELHATRCSDGRTDIASNWIHTDANGSATKGPWTVTADETTTNIYIRWTDGTRTEGGETKVDDFSKPTATINWGYPGSFSGSASDARCGSGFGSWTVVRVTFMDRSTGLYWNGSSYGAPSKVNHIASWSGGGTSITWSKTPPPGSSHVPGHSYEWCVEANDRCSYSTSQCVVFTY